MSNNIFENIHALRPVDKVASIVTSQSGCADLANAEQERDCIVSRFQQMQSEIKLLPKNSAARKRLGFEIQGMQRDIAALNQKCGDRYKASRKTADYIIHFCRERLTKLEYEKIVFQAAKAEREGLNIFG